MHAMMDRLARGLAVAGGVVLVFLILVTCISVLGRALNTILHGAVARVFPETAQWLLDLGVGPILGDFELVEAGIAFAIFASIPLCQISSGHASVDILTRKFPAGVSRFLSMLTEVLFAAVLILIAWRLYEGMLSKRSYGETTFLLQFPIWWAYALSLFGAIMAAIAGIYMAIVRISEFALGRSIIPSDWETDA